MTKLVELLEAYEGKLRGHNEDIIESIFQTKINLRSQKSKNDGRKFNQNLHGEETSRIKEKGNEKQGENKPKYPPCGICK